MRQLLQGFIVSSIVFLIDAYSRQKKNFLCYVTIFLIVSGMGYLFSSEIEHNIKEYDRYIPLDLYPPPPNANKKIAKIKMRMLLCRNKSPTKKDKKYYERKEKFHSTEANRYYIHAKQKMWYLPDLDDREKARYCFTSAVTTAMPGDPRAKIVGVVLQFFLQYGLDCIYEWNYIQNQLYWAAYHFEMADFYFEVLEIYF